MAVVACTLLAIGPQAWPAEDASDPSELPPPTSASGSLRLLPHVPARELVGESIGRQRVVLDGPHDAPRSRPVGSAAPLSTANWRGRGIPAPASATRSSVALALASTLPPSASAVSTKPAKLADTGTSAAAP